MASVADFASQDAPDERPSCDIKLVDIVAPLSHDF